MCVFIFLFSLIPALSGYAPYLIVIAVATESSLTVQLTLAVVLLMSLLAGGWQLLRRSRPRHLKDDESGDKPQL